MSACGHAHSAAADNPRPALYERMGHSSVRWRLAARIDNDARSAFSIDIATPKQLDGLRGQRVIRAVVAASYRHETSNMSVK